MRLLMLKSVVDGNQVHKKNTIVEVKGDTARHYLAVGIAIEHKEQKQDIETKEDKTPKRRRTKKK